MNVGVRGRAKEQRELGADIGKRRRQTTRARHRDLRLDVTSNNDVPAGAREPNADPARRRARRVGVLEFLIEPRDRELSVEVDAGDVDVVGGYGEEMHRWLAHPTERGQAEPSLVARVDTARKERRARRARGGSLRARTMRSPTSSAPAAAQEDAYRRWLIAIALYAAITAVFWATTARERLAAHTPFNHFALLADAWLHGRLDLGGPPPAYTGYNDFAVFEGRYYVSFPPLPAALLVPMVKLAGSAERVRDGAFFLGLAGVGPSVLFLALEALRRARRVDRTQAENAALAALFALGSVYWFSAVQGTVWFAAHVVGVALTALYILFSIDARRPFLAGLCLGLAFATRAPLGFAFPLFLYEALRAARRADPPEGASIAPSFAGADARFLLSRLALFAAPAAAVLVALLWHNAARFGDPLEFGHRLLDIGWRARIEKWGLFSYHYLGRNLGVVLTSLPYTSTAGAPFQINTHGLALWLTTPLYAWALWPKRASALFAALAVTAAIVALPSLLYQNSGWLQFGYRFSNDFALFLFVMIAASRRRFGRAFWALAAFAVAVNGFGAISFQRAGFERFYFVDRTQRILHQPD